MGNLVRVEQGTAPVSLGSCTGKLCLTFWVPFLAASAAALCPLPQEGGEGWNGTGLSPLHWWSQGQRHPQAAPLRSVACAVRVI